MRRFCAPLLDASGQSVEIVVRPGDAAKEIRNEAERLPFDLLILGTHGRSGFERLFLGSVTEKVLRSTRVPVLTIPPPVREPGSPLYKTILCPWNSRLHRFERSNMRCRSPREADARLILLHVIEDVLGDAGAQASLGESERVGVLPTSRAGCCHTAQSGGARRRACLVPP